MNKSRQNSNHQLVIKWLKKCRLQQNLTMRQLGTLLDEPFQFVSKIENGQRNLSVGEFLQYCEALEADPSDFIASLKK
jgi:transcriptional regulator with XRE-family HTH domain